jgi:hypothetical protein
VQRPGVAFAVMLPDDKRPGEFNLAAMLNEKTIVIGIPDLVDAFLAAWTGTQPGLEADKAKRLAGIADSTAAVDAVILGIAEKDRKKTPWLELFSVAVITADSRENFEMTLRLGVKKPAAADPIRKIVEGIRDVYKNLDPDQRQLDKVIEMLLEHAQVTVDNSDVLIRTRVPAETFEQLVREKWLR